MGDVKKASLLKAATSTARYRCEKGCDEEIAASKLVDGSKCPFCYGPVKLLVEAETASGKTAAIVTIAVDGLLIHDARITPGGHIEFKVWKEPIPREIIEKLEDFLGEDFTDPVLKKVEELSLLRTVGKAMK